MMSSELQMYKTPIWIGCLLVSGPTTSAHMQNSSTQAASVKAAVLAGLGIAACFHLL